MIQTGISLSRLMLMTYIESPIDLKTYAFGFLEGPRRYLEETLQGALHHGDIFFMMAATTNYTLLRQKFLKILDEQGQMILQ